MDSVKQLESHEFERAALCPFDGVYATAISGAAGAAPKCARRAWPVTCALRHSVGKEAEAVWSAQLFLPCISTLLLLATDGSFRRLRAA